MAQSVASALAERGAPPLLKGSDLPKGAQSIKVKILAARIAPKNFNSPVVLDIEEQYGKSSIALNKTSARALAEKLGDDCEKWAGKTITLYVTMQNNPKTGKLTRSLTAVEPE